MIELVGQVLLLAAAAPVLLALGARYARWHDELCRRAQVRGAARLGDAGPPPVASRTAAIACVAVVDDELLVHLVEVGPERVCGAAFWLQARTDAIVVEAAERCWVEHRLVGFGVTGPTGVLLDVGGTLVPMQRLVDRAEPAQ